MTVTGTWTLSETITESPTETLTGTITETPTITSTWTISPTSSATSTVTQTKTPCIIIGDPSLSWNVVSGVASNALFEKFTLASQSVVKKIYLYYISNAPGYKVGLYSDASGCPGTLLTGNSSFVYTSDEEGWVAIDVPDYTLPAGTFWLAVTSDGTSAASAGEHWQSGATYIVYSKASLGLPSSIGNCTFSEVYSGYTLLMYASCE